MVSFSEYPLSSINKKNITYGRLGLGMKKSWAERKRLHPVLYLDKNSLVADALSQLLKARRKNTTIELAPNVRLSIITIKCSTKNASGYNSKLHIPNFDFRSEKEWRHVPQKSQIGNNRISVTKRFYDKNPDKYDNQLIPFPLKFKKEDIEYIFVETENQRIEISTLFNIDQNKIKLSKWKTTPKKLLTNTKKK